jgi:hypothetical protein
MSIQRITIPSDQHCELVTVSGEYTLYNALIGVVLINEQFWLRRPHDDRVTQIPRSGQGSSPII